MILSCHILTSTEQDILRMLYVESRTAFDVAKLINIEEKSGWTYLHRMKNKGLVVRENEVYKLTQKGKELGDKIREEWNQ